MDTVVDWERGERLGRADFLRRGLGGGGGGEGSDVRVKVWRSRKKILQFYLQKNKNAVVSQPTMKSSAHPGRFFGLLYA